MEDNLYIIELPDRIKIGRTKNFNRRFRSILSSGGILLEDVLNKYVFDERSGYEQILLKLTKEEKIAGEWRFKKELTSQILEK